MFISSLFAIVNMETCMFFNSKRKKNTQKQLPTHKQIQNARCLAGTELTEGNYSIWGPAVILQVSNTIFSLVSETEVTKEAEVLFVLFSSPLDRVDHCFLAVM